MARIVINANADKPAGIGVDPERSSVVMSIIQGGSACRWCFGPTYSTDDSQYFEEGVPVVLNGVAAQSAISFRGLQNGTIVESSQI